MGCCKLCTGRWSACVISSSNIHGKWYACVWLQNIISWTVGSYMGKAEYKCKQPIWIMIRPLAELVWDPFDYITVVVLTLMCLDATLLQDKVSIMQDIVVFLVLTSNYKKDPYFLILMLSNIYKVYKEIWLKKWLILCRINFLI